MARRTLAIVTASSDDDRAMMAACHRGCFAAGLALLASLLVSLPVSAQSIAPRASAAPLTHGAARAPSTPTPSSKEEVAPARRTVSPATYVAFAIGGVGIFVGSITGLVALNNASTLRDTCDGNRCPADQRDAIVGAETVANVSNVMFAVGGAGVIAGVIAWFVGGSDAATPSTLDAHVKPLVGPGYLGLSGSF